MKKFFPFLLILFFTIIYLSPRLLNLSRNLEFRFDQAYQLTEVKEMFDSRHLRLIGPATSKTIEGRQFFTGVTYYYILAVFGAIFSWSPLAITASIIIIEYLFYTLFINYLRQSFGYSISIFFAILISFTPYLIFHSFFFWNPHFLIPLSIMFIIYRKNPYLSAFIWGLAISFHFSALLWFIPYLIFNKKYYHLKISKILLALTFLLAANLPYIYFELRHNFYNIKTAFLVFSHPSNSFGITTHYFFFSLIIFISYLLICLSHKYNRPIYIILILVFLIQDQAELNRVNGWDYPNQIKISNSIAASCPQNYNVATTIQGDTRAYELRYLLSLRKCNADTVDNYPNNKTLFLVSPSNISPEKDTVWEVNSFKPFKISSQEKVNHNITFYRLDKS